MPWIIFDADNTLWSIEHLYDAAREELCRFIANRGAAESDAADFQQRRDHELHATYGYSACRFARSFEDTLLHFSPSARAEEVRHVRQLALNVFDRQARPVDGLEDLLKVLQPRYEFGLITAGERWVQERRLNDFHLRSIFRAVDIVERKTPEVFSNFCDRHSVDREKSWVVGDSMNSDVIPARRAGLRAVLIRANNWARVEGAVAPLEDDLIAINSLADLAKVPGVLAA